MSEWQECKLGNLITYKKGFAFKSSSYSKNGDVFIVRVSDTTDSSININSCMKITASDAELLSEYKLLTNDIIIATVGSWADNPNSIVGKVIKVPSVANGALLNQNAVRLRSNEKVIQNFIFYNLKDKNFSDYLLATAQGSANQASIKLQDIFLFPISLPPLPEQKAIANILSSLDDKINLLHRQNKTLEAMAETLFRQWFIEEAVNQSERKLVLGELIESVSVTHKFPSNKIIFLNTSDIYLGNVLTYESTDIGLLPGQAKKSIQKNDILFSEIRPANGRYAYIDFDAENFVVSTKLMVLRSKNILSQSFIYFYLTNSQTLDWLQMLAESRSGTFPQITFEQIRNLKINVPTEGILDHAVNWCETAIKKIKSNQKQIKTLEKLRDNLLPKLMSGEVRVRLTEKAHVK